MDISKGTERIFGQPISVSEGGNIAQWFYQLFRPRCLEFKARCFFTTVKNVTLLESRRIRETSSGKVYFTPNSAFIDPYSTAKANSNYIRVR